MRYPIERRRATRKSEAQAGNRGKRLARALFSSDPITHRAWCEMNRVVPMQFTCECAIPAGLRVGAAGFATERVLSELVMPLAADLPRLRARQAGRI